VNTIKLNWYSTLDCKKKLKGVGVIARNLEGNVMASMCSLQQYISNPSVAKACGARQAIEFGRFLGLNSVIVEVDAIEIISTLGKTEEEAGKFGSLIMDARSLLRGFLSWDISHVRHEGIWWPMPLQSLLFLLNKLKCGLSFTRHICLDL
jgi:hypothetical protein